MNGMFDASYVVSHSHRPVDWAELEHRALGQLKQFMWERDRAALYGWTEWRLPVDPHGK